MNQQETADYLQHTLQAAFPDNYVHARIRKILGEPNVYLTFALGKDKSQWSNGIIENDPCYMLFSIDKSTSQVAKPWFIEHPTTHFSNLRRRCLKWRRLSALSEHEAATKLVKWFEKNRETLLQVQP